MATSAPAAPARRLSIFARLAPWCTGVAALLLAATVVGAYPKPSPVPYRWELTFEPGDLRLWRDASSGDYYWFFTYKVTNRTGDEQVWAPEFTLFNDAGEILRSGRGVSSRVTDTLLGVIGNELMEPQNAVIGEIFQGAEHAREGLVIWPADRIDVNEITIFIAGISGETAAVADPITGDEVILRKTLQRDYLIPGNVVARGTAPAPLVKETWILR